MLNVSKSSTSSPAMDAEEQEIMKEVCSCNGITFNRMRQEGLSCLSLELFFSGYPRMVGLHNFPNLQILQIVGQSVKHIECLRSLPKLKELWIVECGLKSMAGLEDAPQLRRLYLYSNSISKIEQVEHMTDLQALWLNGNRITVIEGLSCLKQLREVNLAENLIENIGNSLNNLQQLERLELSGNRIYSFKDITNLTRLGSLQFVGFKSPIYPPCGVGLLCHYAVHVIYHLNQLLELDSVSVSSKAIKDTVEGIVNKKKIFYGMQVKTLRRKLCDIKNRLTAVRDHVMQPYVDRIRTLYWTLKEIDKEVYDLLADEDEPASYGSGTESDQDAKLDAKWSENRVLINGLRSKQKVLRERIKQLEKKIAELELHFSEGVERVRQATDCFIQQAARELESGGNVRFEYGKATDPWFVTCRDLVMSRFCAKDFREFQIESIQVQRITRVSNRELQLRFDEAIESSTEEDDCYLPSQKSTTYKKQVEYLFWVCDPEMTRGQSEPARTIEEGFMSASTYRQLGKTPAVPLSNSVRIADKYRIEHCLKHNKGKEAPDACPFRNGRLVIAKAYIGQSIQYRPSQRIEESDFEQVDSIYRTSKELVNIRRAGGDSNACECSTRQFEWFVHNHEMVIPVYIVDFEYVPLMKPRSPFHHLVESEITSLDKESTKPMLWPEPYEEKHNDEELLNSPPEIKSHPRIVALSDEVLLKMTRAQSLSVISVLSLHGNGLIRLKHLQALTRLKRLTVTYNDLTKLDDLSGMNIEYLDASFNKISSLDGMKNMSKLRCLDLIWNRLKHTRDEISWLHKHAPVLTTLDVRHNPWQKPENMRLRVLGQIRTITKFNCQPVLEDEVTAALRMAAGSRVSQVTLLSHSRMDSTAPRTLCLSSVAQVLSQTSRFKPDRLAGDQDIGWQSKITSLCLDGQHLSKFSGLEQLTNLKWASFNDNYITKIEGLDSCRKLEELSLENNCVQRIEGLSSWPLLRRLSLGHNYITTLDDADLHCHGDRIQHLSLENNCITSLAGLQKVVGLVELFLSNNLIDSVREVFFLKNLPNLIILDLCGNPVSLVTDNYRLFVIYYLKNLKALDGASVDVADSQLAKETLGGKMTVDFVAERLGHSDFSLVKELDCPQCGIQTVDLAEGQPFQNLQSVNLEHNNLASFSGLIHLKQLKVLFLNHNRVESVLPKTKSSIGTLRPKHGQLVPPVTTVNYDLIEPVLSKLEVLHLGYNGIKDLPSLQLGLLPSLKALFLQGNDISKLEGLESLKDLLELVLDRNKIKSIGEFSFESQRRLQELHIEENRLRSLANLHSLENLQRLFVGMNRIQDMPELERLEPLAKLNEVSLVNNAIAKRQLHRPVLVYRNPTLNVIDGITVTDEERTKAQIYFTDFQQQQSHSLLTTTSLETNLPGFSPYKNHIPVKVTNVQLLSPQVWGTSGAEDAALHDFIKGGVKKKGAGRSNFDAANITQPGMSGPYGAAGNATGAATVGISFNHGTSSSGSNKPGGLGNQLTLTSHYAPISDYPLGNDRYTKNAKR